MLGLSALARAAAAEPPQQDACFSAPVEAQKLQRDGRLLEARERFAACARNTCPPEIVTDCARWVTDVNAAIPSVVMAARDGQRRDVVDARVSIDGRAGVEVTGRAIPLDPGSHKFVFQSLGHPDVAVDVLLREGEKNREVSATLSDRWAPAPPAPRSDAGDRPVPASVWIVGGVGTLGLASFSAFGALGVAARSADHCDTGCTQTQKGDVDSKFMIANVSLGVAVVGLGVATWLFLARPATERPPSALVDLRAVPGGGVAVLGSRF
jgi:hypothetical protein